MGDFTSKYQVTYSDGSTQTETRVDTGKVFDNAIMPLIILVMLLLAAIAAIPFLVLLPLFLYMLWPYRQLKPILKQNREARAYSSDALSELNYKTVGHLQKSNVIKSFLLLLVSLSAIAYIEYLTFSPGLKNRELVDIALDALMPSLVMAAVIYPLGLIWLQSNRVATRELLTVKPGFLCRTFTKVMNPFRALIKRFKLLFRSLAVVVIAWLSIVAFMAGFHFLVYQPQQGLLSSVLFNVKYQEEGKQKAFEQVDQLLYRADKNINSLFAGQATIHQLSKAAYDALAGLPELRDYTLLGGVASLTKGETILEHLVVMNNYDHQNQGYRQTFNRTQTAFDLYMELDGELNLTHPATNESLLGKTNSIEVYDLLAKQEVSFKGVEAQVVSQIIDNLQDLDKGYSKRLAKLIKSIGLSAAEAQSILDEKQGSLKHWNQMSPIRALKAVATSK